MSVESQLEKPPHAAWTEGASQSLHPHARPPRRHCWDPDGLRGESAEPWGLLVTALLIKSIPMSIIIRFARLLPLLILGTS